MFNDEIGESIASRSYAQVVRALGEPAVVRRGDGRRCAYYEVVGSAGDGWRFCFSSDGEMLEASGHSPPPAPR